MKKIYFSISNHQILRNQSQKYKKAQISSRMRGRCTSRKWKMGWKYFITKNNVENLICREEENNVREKGTVSSKYLQKRKKGVGEWLGSSSLSQSERTQQEGARAGPALSAPTSQRHNLPTATGGMARVLRHHLRKVSTCQTTTRLTLTPKRPLDLTHCDSHLWCTNLLRVPPRAPWLFWCL